MSLHSSRRLPLWLLIAVFLLATVGAALAIYATRWGAWAFSDTVEYFEAARNFADGRGLVLVRASGAVRPLYGRPPFYPILLGLAQMLGLDLFGFARGLVVSLYAAFILSAGLGVAWLSGLPVLGVCLSLFALVAPIQLLNFTSAMTEAPFLVLSLAAFLLLVEHFQRPRPWKFALSAGLMALSFLTRYTGAAFIVSAAALVLVFNPGNLRRRFGAAMLYGLVAVAPFLIWTLSVAQGGATPGAYHYEVDNLWTYLSPVRGAYTDQLWSLLPFNHLLAWSFRFKLIALSGLLLLTATAVALTARQMHRARNPVLAEPGFQLGAMFSLGALAYGAFVALTYVVVAYPPPALNDRVLSPMTLYAFAAGLTWLCWLLARSAWRSRLPGWLGQAALALPVLIPLALGYQHLPVNRATLTTLHTHGWGYTSAAWSQSELLERLAEIPSGTKLISNDIDATLYFLNRPAFRLAQAESAAPLDLTQPYGSNPTDATQALFIEGKAVLVLFFPVDERFLVGEGQLTETQIAALTAGLEVVASASDGAIYAYAGAK